jgi:hypothetical protein
MGEPDTIKGYSILLAIYYSTIGYQLARSNLDHRHILAPDAPRNCIGYVGVVESSTHLFLHCPSAIRFGIKSFGGWGLLLSFPSPCLCSFKCLGVRWKIIRYAKVFWWFGMQHFVQFGRLEIALFLRMALLTQTWWLMRLKFWVGNGV